MYRNRHQVTLLATLIITFPSKVEDKITTTTTTTTTKQHQKQQQQKHMNTKQQQRKTSNQKKQQYRIYTNVTFLRYFTAESSIIGDIRVHEHTHCSFLLAWYTSWCTTYTWWAVWTGIWKINKKCTLAGINCRFSQTIVFHGIETCNVTLFRPLDIMTGPLFTCKTTLYRFKLVSFNVIVSRWKDRFVYKTTCCPALGRFYKRIFNVNMKKKYPN